MRRTAALGVLAAVVMAWSWLRLEHGEVTWGVFLWSIVVGVVPALLSSRRLRLATVPIAAMYLGTVITIIPASQWMARTGRRAGFVVGAMLGTSGGVVGAWGVYSSSTLVLSLGALLIASASGGGSNPTRSSTGT